jgi:hypothetical protein
MMLDAPVTPDLLRTRRVQRLIVSSARDLKTATTMQTVDRLDGRPARPDWSRDHTDYGAALPTAGTILELGTRWPAFARALTR